MNTVKIILIGNRRTEVVEISASATVRDVATRRYNLFGENKYLLLNGKEVPWHTPVEMGDTVHVGRPYRRVRAFFD